MIIIFEEHQYDASLVQEVLKDISVLQDVEKKVSVNYVGYFYSNQQKDCVFILPKVLLKDEGSQEVIADIPQYEYEEDGEKKSRFVTPEDIITREGQEKFLSKEYRKFIYEFAVWIYRVLCVYRKKNAKSKAIYFKQLPQGGKGIRHAANTFLDILLSLIDFNQKNQDFFLFTIKNIHSGVNKINWQKTIVKSECILQNDTPIYLNPINKKRKINFDEELFIIFFSILNYINKKYGFNAPINFQYELLNDNRFKQYLKGYGQVRLRQIKYKYFSDKTLMLWDLCYAFFDSTHKLSVNTDQKEYLLAKNFNIIFEAMIDELIGTPHDKIPRGLADQKDGKRVDHLYTYDSLVHTEDKPENDIYYIGDSKYYKADNKLGSESIYKQYTYARNVIQWNINLFLNDDSTMPEEERKARWADKQNFSGIKVRKEEEFNVAEGYNVIPNFFISAFVYNDRRYVAQENIKGHEYMENGVVVTDEEGKPRPQTYISYQFPNRLFDRDTLILSHYDVNFLYVVYLYARNKEGEKAQWRRKVRDKFRDEIRKVLEEKFDIYAMMPHAGDDVAVDFIHDHFSSVLGKIYTPYAEKDYYALALNKSTEFCQENKELKDEASKFFYITDEPVQLGQDPSEALCAKIDPTVYHIKHKKGILVGLVKNSDHKDWIKQQRKYNIRKLNDYYRAGSQDLKREYFLVNEVVLYRIVDEEPEIIGMFNLLAEDSIPECYDYQGMKMLGTVGPDYPYGDISDEEKEKREYIIYEINTEKELPLTDVDKAYYSKLIKEKGRDENGKIGAPFVI